MGWLASLFGTDNQRLRKGQAISSTHEAFSLPTSSPGFHPHPDAFNPDALNTPDPESAMSPTYTYPPQGSSVYGYVPTSAGMNSRPTSASLLPTHMDALHSPFSPNTVYPPLSKTWNRLRAWLNREYPELGDTLNYGILPQDLAQIEMQFGFALPAVVRESYLCVDGQEAESAAGCSEGLFFGLKLLSLEDVLEEWRFWREVDEDPSTGSNVRLREMMDSIPPSWVRKEYSQRGWIPLIADKTGNYVGVDLNPAEGGSVGQVIVFGRDFDTKVVLWKGDGPVGWARWLASFVEELEGGEGFEIGPADSSDDSEDDLGYESYYHDGRGQGDGGGDNGAGGGIRLSGEYRGWNVLDAWADRSLRKWHEAGLIPSISPVEEDVKGKGVDKVGLGVLDLTQSSGAEIPIPVLADIDEPIPPPPAANGHVTSTSISHSPTDLPTISVTKPPAPLPVELPTPHDIEPIPSPVNSFDEDLESGQSRGMREVSREEAGLPYAPRRIQRNHDLPPDTPSSATAFTVPAEPLSPPPSDAVAAPLIVPSSAPSEPLSSPQPRAISPPVIPDLLADSGPTLNTVPIEPSPSPRAEIPPPLPSSLANGSDDNQPEEPIEEEFDPDTTIRLVGGGGIAGIVEPFTSEPEVPEVLEAADDAKDSDVQSVTSVTSETSVKKGDKPHKKTKSGLAGLKKLGLGRKRDSVSSVKDVSLSTPK